MNTYRPGSYS